MEIKEKISTKQRHFPSRKYTLDFLIKKRSSLYEQNIIEIINDLMILLQVSRRKIYNLKQAKINQDSKEFTLTQDQRDKIASYFNVSPNELDTR